MPFFWLGIATVVGAFLARNLKLDAKMWLIAFGVSFLLFIADSIARHREHGRRKLSVFLIASTICLSALLYTHNLPKNTAQYIPYYNDKGTVNLTGLVVEPPKQTRGNIELIVRVESIKPVQSDENAQSVKGKLLVEVPLGHDFKYGDRVSVYGELSQPPEGHSFSYRDYLFHKGIYSMSQYGAVKLLSRGHGCPAKRALYALRERSSQVLQNNFPNPESALLRGILLGDESGISSELARDYSRTGTSHIIAISGFNMAVLAGVVSAVLRKRMGRWRGSWIAIGVLLLYTLFVGGTAAVTRAFIMSSITILGSSIARRGNLLNSLGLSVFMMVLFNPHLPWDIGFQFSVMATLALSLFATPLQAWVEDKLQKRIPEEKARQVAGFLSEYFLITLIAQVLVLPLILYHFRQISWLFLIANPLILPFQPLVMILGLIALVGGLFSLGVGQFLSWLSWPFVAYTNAVVSGLARLMPNVWNIPGFSPLWLGVYYTLIFLLAFRPKLKQAEHLSWKPIFAILTLGSLVIVLGVHLASLPDGKLNIKVLSQSESPVLLARTPKGEFVLSGGSGDSTSLAEAVSRALPPFKQKIAYVIVPACKKADLNGLFSLPEQVELGKVLWGCDPESSRAAQTLYSYFEAQNLNQIVIDDQFLLNWEDGTIAFEFGEKELGRLSIQHGGFSGMVDYANIDNASDIGEWSLWIGEANTKATCAPIMLNTSDTPHAETEDCPASFIQLSQYDWVKISTDGKQVWLSGR